MSFEDMRNLEEEIETVWVKIEGYDYEVSNKGSVRNSEGKVLAHNYDKDGYPRVSLWKDGESKTFNIHRLVATAFCENPNPEHYDQVNHIDECKTDNFYLNLEWCDNTYNRRYGTGAQRAGEANSRAIIGTNVETGEEELYESTVKAAEHLNGTNAHICDCANGKRKTAYGRTWRYADEKNS